MSEPNESACVNRQWLLRSRPKGEPTTDNFELRETPLPDVGDGDVLRQTLYLSLDPYMRGRMSEGPSYASPALLGEPMVGATVSQVVASKNPTYTAGDYVLGYDGWQSYGISDGTGLRKIDPSDGPLSYALGALGMPGLTAYAALLRIGAPKAGETLVVSAAAGAVGSLVGQIGKIKGCHVVGLAGSDDKCRFVVETLGFDECINYKTADLASALRTACPNGIDVYYDNVAGRILETVLGQINLHARIPLVGLISQYNATTPPPGPNLMPLLVKRAKIEGFLVGDHQGLAETFQSEMSGWIKEGRVRPQEDIVEGIENAPTAFLGLFSGSNLGKLIVRVAPDPSQGAVP